MACWWNYRQRGHFQGIEFERGVGVLVTPGNAREGVGVLLTPGNAREGVGCWWPLVMRKRGWGCWWPLVMRERGWGCWWPLVMRERGILNIKCNKPHRHKYLGTKCVFDSSVVSSSCGISWSRRQVRPLKSILSTQLQVCCKKGFALKIDLIN